jgi:methyl-accepting chemotaxis protein
VKWFKDLKISSKLLLCFTSFAMIAGLVGWAGISGLTKIGNNADAMYNDQLIPIRDLGYATTSVQLARAEARDMLIEKNLNGRQKFIDAMSVEDKKIDSAIEEYSKTHLSKEEQEVLPKFKSALEQYRKVRVRVFELLLKGQDAAAWALMNGEAKQYATDMNENLRRLVDINVTMADEQQKQNKAAETAARTQVIGLLIFGVVAASGIGVFLARLIGRPMAAMQDAAEKLAVGDVNVTVELDSKDELGELARSFRNMIDMIKDRATVAQRLAAGDVQSEVTVRSDQDVLGKAFLQVIGALRKLIAEMDQLTTAAALGKLATRGNAQQFEGAYRRVVEGVNSTLDAVIGPLNMAAGYVDRISKGDIPPKITDNYVGDFNAIKNNLNQCIDAVYALVQDANMLSKAAVEGKLDTRADATTHAGDFRKIVAGVNATLDAVVGPLKEVESALNKLADGDFTAQIEKQYAGEFNELKNAVNTMVAQVRSALLKIGKETNTLASASEQLGRVSQQMSASAEETAAQANVVSAASEQVSTNIQTVATGADEMGASIKEIAKNTAEATKIANNAVQLSKTTNDTVRKLGTSSAEIGQVIKVITSIAQQTNLLALNATIEAARAGEAGKGFAVVANEVKELAKQTAQATEDISQKIQAIQEDASGAVTAIGQITEVIGQISDIQNTVATAIEEQSATTNEISRNLAEAAKGGADITLNITSVAQVAKTTTEAAGQTQMSAKSLEETASQLRELVGQFRYEDAKAMAMAAHAGR